MKKKLTHYVIQIHGWKSKKHIVQGGIRTYTPYTRLELLEAIIDFATENKICRAYALEHLTANEPVQELLKKPLNKKESVEFSKLIFK